MPRREFTAVLCRYSAISATALLSLCIFSSLQPLQSLQPVRAARAEVPDELEPDYADAVLAYNGRNYREALKLLDSLVSRAPETAEFLELRALNLKALGRYSDAVAQYRQLIQLKSKGRRPASEVAPYHFELGLIYFRAHKGENANRYFETALANGFNVSVCHLYLGMIDFQSEKWNDAEEHFQSVLSSKSDNLKPVARYYLGQTYMKLDYPAGAMYSLAEARNSARVLADDAEAHPETRKIARQVIDATDRSLTPFDHGQFFGNVGMLAGYDSNVLSVPNSIAGSPEASGKATAKGTMQGGVGYASSALRTFQLIPSYRGSVNFNLNKNARSAQYAINTASLYMTVTPLSRISYGLKAEGGLTFKNDVDESTNKGTFRSYSKTAVLGSYFKYQMSRKFIWSTEFSGRTEKYDDDPKSGETRRSGPGFVFRTALQNERGARFWNPGVVFGYENCRAAGAEYFFNAWNVEFNNVLHVGAKTDLSFAMSYGSTRYPSRPDGARNDKVISGQMIMNHRLSPHWVLLGNMEAMNNKSNVDDSYSYRRYAVNWGVSFLF